MNEFKQVKDLCSENELINLIDKRLKEIMQFKNLNFSNYFLRKNYDFNDYMRQV